MAFSSTLAGKKDIILLLDDSSSINDNNFALMKMFSQTLISKISPETRLAILTFHSSHSIVSVFTNKKDVLSTALEGYRRLKGSTNLVAGLTECGTFFHTTSAGTEKLVIVVTDGIADSDPSHTANQIRNTGVEIVALGVGSGVTVENLAKFASFQRVYHFETFNGLLDFIGPDEHKAREHAVQLLPVLPIQKTGIKENLVVQIKVKNAGIQPLPHMDIHFYPPRGENGRSYFADAQIFITTSIQPNGWEIITVEFESCNINFEHIPKSIPFKIFDLKTRKEIYCAQSEFLLSSEWFTKKYVNYVSPKPDIAPTLNIILFGVIGSGKSAFMNSILTSLLPEYTELANVGGADDHVTKNIRCFPISRSVDGLENCNINLWDTWGVDLTNYRAEFLSEILQGKIPDDFEMLQANKGKNNQVKDVSRIPDISRIIHGVFLFVPIGVLEDVLMCERVKELLSSEINSREINADIIVTRADTVSNPRTEQVKIAKYFNLAENRVHLVSNYTKDKEKNFAIDKVALNILDNTVKKSEAYIRAHLANKIRAAQAVGPVVNSYLSYASNSNYSPSPASGSFNNYNSFLPSQGSQPKSPQPSFHSQDQPSYQSHGQQPSFQPKGPQPSYHSQDQPPYQSHGQQPPFQPQGQQQYHSHDQLQFQSQPINQIGTVFGGFHPLVVKKNNDTLIVLPQVNDQSIEQFEVFLSNSFGYPVILQKTHGNIYLRDIVKIEGNENVVYIADPNLSFQQMNQQNFSSNGAHQPQHHSSNNLQQYGGPQQISYSSSGQYQPINSNNMNNQLNSFQPPNQAPKFQSQPQFAQQPPQSQPPVIIISQNGTTIGAIRTNIDISVTLSSFRERIRREIPHAIPNFVYYDEYNCLVSGPQEGEYSLSTILTNGNTLNIRNPPQ